MDRAVLDLVFVVAVAQLGAGLHGHVSATGALAFAGTASADWALGPALTAAAGFILAAGPWWLYFGRLDEEVFNTALAGDASERRRSFVFGLALVQRAAPGGLPGRALAARGVVALGAVAVAVWGAGLDALVLVALCAAGVTLAGAAEAAGRG